MFHKHAQHLSDVILGGQDGLVNVLGISIGVVAASADVSLVLLAGLSAMFAESISMGAVAYTSTLAGLDYERKMRLEAGMGRGEIEKVLGRLKGFGEKKMRFIRSRLLPAGEPGPSTLSAPYVKAIKVWLACMAGSMVPLWPYFFLEVHQAAPLSILSAALVLFSTGALKARWTVGDWRRSGAEMLLVGGLAALAGYVIGLLLRTPV